MTQVTRLKNLWHFNNAVLEVENSISDDLTDFIGILRGTASLIAVTPDLDGAKFQLFVNRLQLKRWYPGVQGVGYAAKITANETNWFEQRLRTAGGTNSAIYPPGNRAIKCPVLFLQPLDQRNERALGYDMFSEPVRRAAMLQAATNEPAISGKVTLVQEIYNQKQPGFILYVPVFRSGTFPDATPEREQALLGFVYSPFRAGDFFNSVFRADRGTHLHFKIYDGTNVTASALLYESTNKASAHPWITTNQVLQIPGHQWTIAFETTPEFEEVLGGKTAVFVPSAGAAASLIIFAFTFYFVRQHEELLRRGEERDKAQEQAERLNRELEKRVEERTAQLQETNSQLESFIYSVAHDLRTPLRSIRGFAEILEEDCGPKIDEQGRKHINRIIRASGEMDDLIKDLLEYSRVSRDRVELAPVQLDELFSELRLQLESEIQEKNASVSIQPHLPTVLAHEPTLRQTFANLLSNALKFVKPGEKPDVRIYSEVIGENRVRVWVEDKGVGIEPEHHDRIFGVFERLNPETYGGTGIGLAIVRRAIERMGGRVGVQSELEQGSRFYVELRKA